VQIESNENCMKLPVVVTSTFICHHGHDYRRPCYCIKRG